MRKSEKVQRAFENCLSFGDSEELTGHLGDAVDVGHSYVSHAEFEDSDGVPSFQDVALALAELDAEAADRNRTAYVLQDDGNGVWILSAPSEGHLVAALLRAGARMEHAARTATASPTALPA